MILVWILVIVGTLIGAGDLLIVLTTSSSAPQQAAGAAMAVAWAALPYVFARACQALVGAELKELKRVNETWQSHIRSLAPPKGADSVKPAEDARG